MKFNKLLNEMGFDDISVADRQDLRKKLMAQKVQTNQNQGQDVVKIELRGIDKGTGNTMYGDKKSLQVSTVTVNGMRKMEVIGQKIRFATSTEAQSDGLAVAKQILHYDATFQSKFSELCGRLVSKMQNFAPTNNIFDFVYDAKTGKITATPDI